MSKNNKKSCLYIKQEIEFVTLEMVKHVEKIQELQEKRDKLTGLLDEMLCWEDTSPEAIARNQKLAEELKREFWPQDFIK